jgi:hypothetical protein
MRVSRVAATIAAVAIVSGCGVTHHGAAAVAPSAAPAVASSTATSAPATSAPATSHPASSAPATSARATSHPATSAPATSAPATHPVTAQPVASARVTSAPVTSARATSARATSHPIAARPAANPATVWLESPGGQAQVTFNDDVDALAAALEAESLSTTVANHLVFEADARIVRAEASKILATRALLPTVNQAAYKQMLNDFITVADLLQPGPGYGTTPQDDTAWNAALIASNIAVT